MMIIDVVCRVVDNYGDIGFAFRLARSLVEDAHIPNVRLIVDDVSSFSWLLAQKIENLHIYTWDVSLDQRVLEFRQKPPTIVIETYACGRPDWFDELLFDSKRTDNRIIINIDYLTAETWAKEYHLLNCPTRSSLVKKYFFMPGFTQGSGGLLQDAHFKKLLAIGSTSEGLLNLRLELIQKLDSLGLVDLNQNALLSSFWVLLFTYEHDYSDIVEALANYAQTRSLLVFVAEAKSKPFFIKAWEKAGCPFSCVFLPFLEQGWWDHLQRVQDFSFIRGEESFARAMLIGKPFLWDCYPFGQGEQVLKIEAFLSFLRPFFKDPLFDKYAQAMRSFNACKSDFNVVEALNPCKGHDSRLILEVLRSDLSKEFADSAQNVRNVGNLLDKLMTYIGDLGYDGC